MVFPTLLSLFGLLAESSSVLNDNDIDDVEVEEEEKDSNNL